MIRYQALEDNAPQYVHDMFASLVPGFLPSTSTTTELSSSVFHDTNMQYPVRSLFYKFIFYIHGLNIVHVPPL